MINTFHSSFNPPPVPPRQGHRGTMLQTNTPLVKFLSVMLLLLMVLTFGGFLYLFHRLSLMQCGYSNANFLKQFQLCKESHLRPEDIANCKKLAANYEEIGNEGVAYLTGKGFFTTPLARLILKRQTTPTIGKPDSLLWNEDHSLLKNILLNTKGIVTIQYPGYYFVYSQVTFSKQHMKVPLRQAIWTQKPKKDSKDNDVWEKLLVSYCSLPQDSSVPNLCTASNAGVFEFEENQQLFVNVTVREFVNEESSTFGLFKLQD
ncbi:hypothetical protein NFI96_024668 [Prochilodus magdalenae]|nr:hypothetical protein NFI96_024668 [Prochilodus magdalenae]